MTNGSLMRRHSPKGPWTIAGHQPVLPRIARRGFLAGGVAAAALLAIGGKASSFEVTSVASPFPAVKERPGVVPWRVLSKVTGDGWAEPFAFGPEVELLDGTEVTIDGYMLPYDDSPEQNEFLLSAHRAHCPYCMPGGMPSMIDVTMSKAVPLTEGIVSVRGKLELVRSDGYGLLYQIVGAVPA